MPWLFDFSNKFIPFIVSRFNKILDLNFSEFNKVLLIWRNRCMKDKYLVIE